MILYINLIVEKENSDVAVPKVLDVFKDHGKVSLWKMKYVEACGWPGVFEQLHTFSNTNEYVDGREFYSIVTPKIQIIDGTFYAYDTKETEPWLTLEVNDCTDIIVITDEDDIITALRHIYSNSESAPIQGISPAPETQDSGANSEEKSETSNVDTNGPVDKSDQRD